MKGKEEKVSVNVSSVVTTKDATARDKALLWPILCVLGVERKKWERFRYFPDQIVGLIISCINQREICIRSLTKQVKDLKKQNAKLRQTSFDFKGCPFNVEEKP